MKERFIAAAGNIRSEREKGNEIITLICNNSFWTTLKENNQHLQPLLIANMILQRDSLYLDHVCLMFSYLYNHFNTLKEDRSIIATVCYSQALQNVLDQSLFILSVLLNPFLMVSNKSTLLSLFNPQDMKLWQMFLVKNASNLFTILFECQPDPNQLIASFLDYFSCKGDFNTDFWIIVRSLQEISKKDEKEADPTYIWRLVPDTSNDLKLLALHLYPVCPNSASCERVFSSFGIIHSKLKNTLSFEKVAAIGKVKALLCEEQKNVTLWQKKRRLYETNSTQPTYIQQRDLQELDIQDVTDFIMLPVEFEVEAISWIADLTPDSPMELNDTQLLPTAINLKLSVLFDHC
ncbi:hypothetical protein L873DRAFT_1755863 [Choiromyces venosus 120613-1]|uniref:HAT C-terminal dimerisation domain-containing protein n=1 Tax=Choiromyces venosus 120613-1 TaxID=1336337 RepID=A0A3N4ITP1_9PEZI|nr:hypothetical protein L873DRAFT_1755863 [Choiromyces venosus 120613-1]